MEEPGLRVWWPFVVALQGEIANHREVRRSRAGVLSVAEKACCQRVRCGSRRRARAISPGELRGSRRVLRAPGGETPPGDSPRGAGAWHRSPSPRDQGADG